MQTFLSFESTNDDQLIESSENELAIRALKKIKNMFLYLDLINLVKLLWLKDFLKKIKKN